MAERLNFRLIDFRFLNSPEQRWHRSRCSSHACESAASNSPSKKAWRTSFQSEQAPAALMLGSGAGGEIMTMRTMSLSENISRLA
jgi:tRNA G46 methylase TrmB